jgi:hypothetical protein
MIRFIKENLIDGTKIQNLLESVKENKAFEIDYKDFVVFFDVSDNERNKLYFE